MLSSRKSIEPLALNLLDALEGQEYELLVWGFLDGGFSADEVEDLAQDILDQHGESLNPRDLVKMLKDRRLLFDFPIGDQRVFRTRFAESVRLLAHLRQMFRAEEWRVAPKLVADFRLSVRPRRYPRRNVTMTQILNSLQEQRKLGEKEMAVLEALLHSADSAVEEVRLADFQVEATAHLLSKLRGKGTGGTIICAGTGTGKTLAFYLPCLMKVASSIRGNDFWTQAIAIYPRNELLRDQFTEAYAQTRRTDGAVQRYAGRKMRIGAFFGSTPTRARLASVEGHWEKRGSGFVCPFLVCPNCGKEFVWHRQDIESGRERLVCVDGQCHTEVHEDEVMLTRNRMQETPPDILFTTTEMLNRQMSSSRTRHIFGIGLTRERSPYLMLLDEAHTYNGIHGAQVALLIRRWRCLVHGPVQFVGLSATLTDAQGFFAQLIGLSSGTVTAIGEGSDLEEEGKVVILCCTGLKEVMMRRVFQKTIS